MPLDFFSWHSYGGRGQFNPYQYYRDAMRVRKALNEHGFKRAENINTEWNAGIQHRLFSDTPSGAAFYASTLACMLDAGVDYAFQYCGDRHPGLGLHGLSDGKPKICAYSFQAWKRLLDAADRVAAGGSDRRGYNVVAGKDASGRHVRILISDFQSGHDGFRLRVTNLPWDAHSPFAVKLSLLTQNIVSTWSTSARHKVERSRSSTPSDPHRSASLKSTGASRKIESLDSGPSPPQSQQRWLRLLRKVSRPAAVDRDRVARLCRGSRPTILDNRFQPC